MIVVKIELWPRGDESKKQVYGQLRIANVGGDLTVGHYVVEIQKSPQFSKRAGIWRKGRVEGFPRLRLGPHDLLLRALIACIGDRSRADVGAVPLEGMLFDTCGEPMP